MATLLHTTCLMLLLGMVFTWPYPLLFERHFPATRVHTSAEEGSASSPSLFDEMDRMMANMFDWPIFSMDPNNSDYDLLDDSGELNLPNEIQLPMINDIIDVETRLDAVEPVCTTITYSPITISPRKSRRKKFPTTYTTTCIRELILNGQKHFSEEITTTDEKGLVIEHSKSTGVVSLEKNPLQQL